MNNEFFDALQLLEKEKGIPAISVSIWNNGSKRLRFAGPADGRSTRIGGTGKMNNEFFDALQLLEKEKGIPAEYLRKRKRESPRSICWKKSKQPSASRCAGTTAESRR